jgi:hypothetical protein
MTAFYVEYADSIIPKAWVVAGLEQEFCVNNQRGIQTYSIVSHE